MTKETMTITQMIAETKRLDRILKEARMEMTLIKFYRKDNPFINGRTVEEFTNKMKADLQSYIDNQKRLSAIKKALTKANRSTTLTVPTMPLLINYLSPLLDDDGEEEITIAEAINRKIYFKNILLEESRQLLRMLNNDLREKNDLDEQVANYIERTLSKKFPPELKQAWSTEKYDEAKKREIENTEIIRIDPCNLIDTDAISKYANAVAKYLADIDTLLSQVNASTTVEVEY